MFKSVKKIGRLFKDLSNEDKVKALYTMLGEQKEIISLRDHPGWNRLTDILKETADITDSEIINLCSAPIKNMERLVYLKSNRDAIYALIGIASKSKEDAKTLNEKIDNIKQKLEEAIRLGLPV